MFCPPLLRKTIRQVLHSCPNNHFILISIELLAQKGVESSLSGEFEPRLRETVTYIAAAVLFNEQNEVLQHSSWVTENFSQKSVRRTVVSSGRKSRSQRTDYRCGQTGSPGRDGSSFRADNNAFSGERVWKLVSLHFYR